MRFRRYSGARAAIVAGSQTGLDAHPALWQDARVHPLAHQSTSVYRNSCPAHITAGYAERPIRRHLAVPTVKVRVETRPAPIGWAWTSSVTSGKVGAQSCVDHAD